jgi:excisionase family DNA binding protein
MVERLMNVREVARLLGVSVHTVYAWSSRGRLPIVKIGTRTMFDPEEIRRWVAERCIRERRGSQDQVIGRLGQVAKEKTANA